MALVAVMAVGQSAHASKAGGGKEAKPPGAKAAAVRDAKTSAGKAATGGADKAPTTSVVDAAEAAVPYRMTATQKANLGQAVKIAVIATAVDGAIAQSKTEATRDLGLARIEALGFVKADPNTVTADAAAILSPTAKLEQGFDALAVNGGQAARDWTPELRSHLTFLLQTATALQVKGVPKAEAMKQAIALLEQPAPNGRAVKLNIDEVNKWCNRA